MLQTQIAYLDHLETVRHNKTSEKEVKRHNVASEVELNRHQVVVEIETERHNRATEQYNENVLAETVRHNKESERLTGQQLAQNMNIARMQYSVDIYNAQTNRELGLRKVAIEQQNADTNAKNAKTQALRAQNESYMNAQVSRHYRESDSISRSKVQVDAMNALTSAKRQAADQAYQEGSLNVSKYTAENNASLGWNNLAVSQREQDRKNRELQQRKVEFNWQKYVEDSNVKIGWANAIANAARSIGQITNGLGNIAKYSSMIP